MSEPKDFEEFWSQFVRGHRSPLLRWCHVAALGCAAGAALSLARGRILRAAVLGGTAAALAGGSHYVIDGHGPENLGHPLWGGRAFVRLCVRTVLGTISAEIPPAP